MKTFRKVLLAALALVCAIAAVGQTVTVTGSHVQDAAGNLCASCRITFAPVDANGRPLSFRIGGGGTVVSKPVSAPVTNGAFSIVLPDVTQTSPVNVCFSTTVTDVQTGYSGLGSGYACVQPGVGSWAGNFDNYVPNTPGLPVDGLVVTTTGSSGAATYHNGILNIPQYTGGSGSMTWPTGGDAIPHYNGASGWGTSYSASNQIPAGFIPTLNQSTTGNAATATTATTATSATTAASATTADSLSAASALPSGTTATTQSTGDNSTKLATDAFVAGALSGFSAIAPPQNRPGGSLTLGTAPDNLSGDRHVFNMRQATVNPLGEFDGNTGTISCPNGICTGSSQTAFRNMPLGPYTSYTVICNALAPTTSGSLSACAGVTSAPSFYGAFFSSGGAGQFGYNNTTTFVPVATLTGGSTYNVSTVGFNGFAEVGYCPVGHSVAGCGNAVIQSAGAPPIVTVQMQLSGTGGISNFSYAMDNPSGSSPAMPNMIAIPPHAQQAGQPLPINLQVPSNPAGSQVNLLVILPTNYNPAATNSWVMWIKGDGGSVFDIFNIGVDTQMADGLLQAGYVLVASDYTSNSCWGNNACTLDIQSALSQALLQFNLDPIPYCYAGSMGGMVMLNSISHGTLKCRAAEMSFPTYSMSNIYAGGTGIFNSQLQTAYSCSSVSTCNAAFLNSPNIPYDPSLVGAKVFSTTPMDVRCSASDTTVNCAANGQALVTAVNAVGGASVFTACTGAHGDPSCVLPAAAVDFFKQH